MSASLAGRSRTPGCASSPSHLHVPIEGGHLIEKLLGGGQPLRDPRTVFQRLAQGIRRLCRTGRLGVLGLRQRHACPPPVAAAPTAHVSAPSPFCFAAARPETGAQADTPTTRPVRAVRRTAWAQALRLAADYFRQLHSLMCAFPARRRQDKGG